ncbi:MAG: pyridoxal phosphate-dependent aminotransferase [Candidatus Aenigmarchaeota archaeon]|nr:pyridoxal phosphate-dependent aminotransferase [Candidatus Aenigmarchaeota archaeon]
MLRNIISEREKELPLLTIGRLLKLAEEGKDVISLGPGEPDFAAPPNVIEAAIEALKKKQTHYSPVEGRTDLKKAIIKKLEKENSIHAHESQIAVTTGSTEGILLSLLCTVDPGQGVLLPDPGFLAYKPTVEILNGMPLPYKLKESEAFQVNRDELERMIVPEKTRAVIINTPSNPTGVVYTKKTLEEIADFANEYDLLIISDEAYEKFVYDDAKHISIASLDGMFDRTITLHSFSKSYAMPGFRLGYAVGKEKIISALAKTHIFTTLAAPTISQIAAVEALEGKSTPSYVKKMLEEYDRRRRLITKGINRIRKIRCIEPKGAFYVFPNIREFEAPSLQFAEWLLKEANVVTVAGTEFGRNGEGHIRLSYASSYEKIETALQRIEKAVKKWKKPAI